jgi:hypothetical protein
MPGRFDRRQLLVFLGAGLGGVGLGWASVAFGIPEDLTAARLQRSVAVYLLACLFLASPTGRAALRRLFHEPGPALNLAVWRIVLFGTLFYLVDRDQLAFYADLPDVLHWPRPGLGAFFSAIPQPPEAVSVLSAALLVACASAMLGFCSRTSALLVTVLGLVVLTNLEVHGKMRWIHHLLWMSSVMALAPCGDALSIDTLLRRQRGAPRPSIAYSLPIHFAWLYLGLVYFYPGFWKFVYSGFEWFGPENLGSKMAERWYSKEFMPGLRIDDFPALLVLGAAGTVIFELAFIFLVPFRPLRPLLVLAGVSFHLASYYFFRIDFHQTLLLYPVLIDWVALGRALGLRVATPAEEPPARTSRYSRPLILTWGVLVLALALGHGGARVLSWPFTVYPLFMELSDDVDEEYSFEIRDRETGGFTRVDHLPILKRHLRHSQAKALSERAVREAKRAKRDEPVRELWRTLVKEEPTLASARRVRVVEREVRLEPVAWPEVPGSRRVLFEFQP